MNERKKESVDMEKMKRKLKERKGRNWKSEKKIKRKKERQNERKNEWINEWMK